MRRTTVLVTVATAAISAITVGGVTFAVAGGNATIHGCVSKESGLLRIAHSCRSNERELSWNQHGPEGEEGDRGPKGDPGPPGTGAGGGLAGYEIVKETKTFPTDADPVPDGEPIILIVDASCPDGKRVVGGGYEAMDLMFENFPLNETTWRVKMGFAPPPGFTPPPRDVTAYAVCAAEGTFTPPPTTQPPTTEPPPPPTT